LLYSPVRGSARPQFPQWGRRSGILAARAADHTAPCHARLVPGRQATAVSWQGC